MPKREIKPSTVGEIPAWFMTYSDVVTLLMTFFILLLTFATNEPESFERMKVSVFGGQGSTGTSGDAPDGVEKDSWVIRVRPRSARMTLEGSETPPINREAAENALEGGLLGLDKDEEREESNTIQLVIPASHLGSPDGELTPYGTTQLDLIARILGHDHFEVAFQYSDPAHLERVISSVLYLRERRSIDQGRLIVQSLSIDQVDPENLQIQLQIHKAREHGTQATAIQ